MRKCWSSSTRQQDATCRPPSRRRAVRLDGKRRRQQIQIQIQIHVPGQLVGDEARAYLVEVHLLALRKFAPLPLVRDIRRQTTWDPSRTLTGMPQSGARLCAL